MKRRILISSWLSAATLLTGLVLSPSTQANDWINPGIGDWSEPANWNGGVPNNSGGWAIGGVFNGGTAVVTTTVPNVSEAWAGNSGVAGTIIVTNGGVLNVDNWLVAGRTGNGGNTPLSTILVTGTGVINKRGDGFVIGDNLNCKGQVIVGGNGRIMVTGGYNQIGLGWDNINEGTVILQDNALFDTPGYDFNVADWGNAHGRCFIRDNATLQASRFWIGKWDNTVGALWQTGGSIIGTGAAANEWCLGGEGSGSPNAFGYYDLAGGLMNNPFNFQVGRWGKGIIYQTGGTNLQGSWTAIGRQGGSLGVMWVTGGRYIHNGAGGTHTIIGEQGRGELTLSGSAVLDCATSLVVGHGYSGYSGEGYCNLNGGTANVLSFEQWGTGTGHLHFNGGTVKPKASNANFLGGLSEARVFAGGAIFDTDGFDITVSQSLQEVSGNGVLSIAVADPGAGYMAPPIVQITGDGIGATAVAQIDPAAGTVTNIVVTCPGYFYSFAPAVTFIGGGAATPATPGNATIGPVTSGGLIKNGAGTLTLTGANTYSAPTVVNGGKLIVTSDSFAAGAYTVGSGGALGIRPTSLNAQLNISSLSLGATGAALDFDLGAHGNPVSAPLSVLGNLVVNGTVAVNIADALPQVGPAFPLLHYTTRSGAGSFVLGTLPSGVQATLTDDTVNKVLKLEITSVGLPRWDGQDGGNWDVDVTSNWIELSTGLPTKFKNGAPALFDDQALGTTTVNLVTTVSPAGVTVTNSVLDYSIVGTGKITGNKGLTKQGSASLTLANTGGNDYTGPTVISGGRLVVTNLANGGQPSAIGSSGAAAANLVLAGGTLSYAGPAVEIDRGYSVQGAGSTIETISDLSLSGPVTATIDSSSRKTGAGRLVYRGAGVKQLSGGAFPGYNVLEGTLVFDGTGGQQVNQNQNEFWVGSTEAAPAHLILSNTVLNVASWFALGRGNGTVGHLSTANLYDSHLRSARASMGYDNSVYGNQARSILTLHGGSTFTNDFELNLGESGGSLAEVFLNGSSRLYSGGRVHIGWNASDAGAGTGMVTVAQSAAFAVNAWVSVGNEGGTGALTVKDNGSVWVLWDLNITDVGTGYGDMTVQDNAQVEWGSLFVGKGAGSTARVSQTGGTMLGHGAREIHIGFHGAATYDLSGGSLVIPSHWLVIGRYQDGPGVLNVTGGTVLHGATEAGRLFRVGEEGSGTLNISGTGAVQTSADALTLGNLATGEGTINLNGGLLQARRIVGGPGAGTLNLNGGVLRAGPNANADFMTGLTAANINAGGAVIDTGANSIGITQPLLAGTGAGGLTKQGSGALYLNGANTYTGTTTVSAGTLGGSGTIAGPVVVSANGTLAPGTSVGTLTINNSLTLNGTTVMEVSKDGDVAASDLVTVIGNLQFGGVLNVVVNSTNALAVNDTFNLFDWGTRGGTFAKINLPAGYTWDTSQLTVDGTIRVTGVVSEPPTVNPPTLVDGQLILTGTGGIAHAGYSWLTSTNVAAPAAEWTPVSTGTFDAAGAFSNSIPVNAAEPVRFFRLRSP
ncbi:MAG TPA: autotransporter-associated beta strand repeat-containing protein [Verrucomicrobiae bacterium]